MSDDDQPTPGLDRLISGKVPVQPTRKGMSPLAKLIIGLVGVSLLAAIFKTTSGPGDDEPVKKALSATRAMLEDQSKSLGKLLGIPLER